MNPTRRRLGIVVVPDRAAAFRIETLRQALGDPHRERIAAHVTLIRPFNVNGDELLEVLDAVAAAALKARSLSALLGPPRVFDSTDTLYLAVDEATAARLTTIREALRVGRMDLPEQYPNYVPHLTLARGLPRSDLEQGAAALAPCRIPATIEKLTVFEMDPAGVWHTLCDFELAAPAVSGRGGFEISISRSEAPEPEVEEFSARAWAEHDSALGVGWDRRELTLVARRNDRVIGVASGWVDGGLGYLGSLIVDTPHRGEGVGRRLVEAFRSATAEHGATRWAVRTFANTEAHAWYLHHGWVEEARFADWIEGREFVQLRS